MNSNNNLPKLNNDTANETSIFKKVVVPVETPKENPNATSSTFNSQKEDTKNSNTQDNDNFKTIIKASIDYIKTASSQNIFKLLTELIFVLVFVIIVKFPFDLIIDLGHNIFTALGIDYTSNALAFWNISFNVLYTIIGLCLYAYLYKERVYKNVIKKNNNSKKAPTK